MSVLCHCDTRTFLPRDAIAFPFNMPSFERRIMILSNRSSALALLTVAFLSLAAFGSAEASQWLLSQAPAVIVISPAIDSLSQIQLAATAGKYRDGSFTGSAFDAYYGMVQVLANVQNGRLVSVDVLSYPNHQRTSRSINWQALPILKSEV